jgi:hypothetical protein
VFLLGALYFVLKERFYVGAFLLGLSIFARIPNAPLAGVILLYAGFVILRRSDHGWRRNVAVIVATAVIFMASLIPFACTNYLLFGSPVVTGYQRTAVAGDAGEMLSTDHMDKFNQPLLKGAYRLLFDLSEGMIPTNPIMMLAFPGVFWIRRIKDQPKTYLILSICLIQFIFLPNTTDGLRANSAIDC